MSGSAGQRVLRDRGMQPTLVRSTRVIRASSNVEHAMAVVTARHTIPNSMRGAGSISAHGAIPSEAMLRAALCNTRRVRVIRGGMLCNESLGGEVLVDTTDGGTVESLTRALQILDGPAGQCRLCLGDPTIELSTWDRRRIVLGVHHGTHVRWNEWHDDAQLASPAALLAWLETNGISYVSREEANPADAFESRAQQRWIAATPSSLRQFADRDLRRKLAASPSELLSALRAELPEPRDQALALFEWLGSGAGTWTVYPAYEQAAERLLLCLPFTALVDCLRSPILNAAQLEGAARFFAGFLFRSERRADAARLSRADTQRLLDYARSSRDPEKEQLALRAFS